MDESLKRLNRYTRQCLTERTDPDFADAVEQAKDELQRPKWIPVSERLPEEGRYVLVAYETVAGLLCHVSML